MSKLNVVLQKQIGLNNAKNILYTHFGQTIEIDPEFLTILEDLSSKDGGDFSEATLRNAVSFAAKELIKRLYAINQFIQIDEKKMRGLERIYLRTWKRILATKNIHSALKNYHYPALTRWIAGLYPESFVEQLKLAPAVGRVVCGEYSPEFQIELLRIDLRTSKQPLLDIGCGSSAGLVRYLRMLQVESYGFDRYIEKEETYLQQSDWANYCFKPDTWGTIISNMAFTNHFLYTYHHNNTHLSLFERKFNEIIASLNSGGSFHYAPSLPFIEQNLDTDKYQLERFAVIKNISITRITKVAV